MNHPLNTLPKLSLLALAAGLCLSACGGSDSHDEAAKPVAMTGVFLDGAVEGLEYVAGSAAKASTNARGEFICNAGDTVTFSAGGVVLGSTLCNPVVTPLTLAASTSVADDKVVNRLLALQLLDDDSDPSNGIKISTEVKTALAGKTLDFAAAPAAFNTALAAQLATLGARFAARTVDSERRALVREHFEDTLASKLRLDTGIVAEIHKAAGEKAPEPAATVAPFSFTPNTSNV